MLHIKCLAFETTDETTARLLFPSINSYTRPSYFALNLFIFFSRSDDIDVYEHHETSKFYPSSFPFYSCKGSSFLKRADSGIGIKERACNMAFTTFLTRLDLVLADLI